MRPIWPCGKEYAGVDGWGVAEVGVEGGGMDLELLDVLGALVCIGGGTGVWCSDGAFKSR